MGIRTMPINLVRLKPEFHRSLTGNIPKRSKGNTILPQVFNFMTRRKFVVILALCLLSPDPIDAATGVDNWRYNGKSGVLGCKKAARGIRYLWRNISTFFRVFFIVGLVVGAIWAGVTGNPALFAAGFGITFGGGIVIMGFATCVAVVEDTPDAADDIDKIWFGPWNQKEENTKRQEYQESKPWLKRQMIANAGDTALFVNRPIHKLLEDIVRANESNDSAG